MWTDNETSVDLLGFTVHKDLLLQLVTTDALLPLTVGVFGDWGGGKSSVMRMIQQDLEGDAYGDIASLYFNSWMFEGYDEAKAALISSILIQLAEHKRFGPKIRDGATSLLKKVNWMRMPTFVPALVGIGATAAAHVGVIDHGTATAVTTSVASLRALSQGKELTAGEGAHTANGAETVVVQSEDRLDWQEVLATDTGSRGPLDMRTFRDDFAALLRETGVRCVVVLIDDLDRCEPARLIENLEAIKLFLSVERTAFVIGADEHIVRYAIATRFADSHEGRAPAAREEPRDLVTDYLEKLIQIPYHLPRLSPSEIESYITLLLCQLHLDATLFERVRTSCDAARAENLYVTFGAGAVRAVLGDTVPDDLARALEWTNRIAPLLTTGLKGNPRQVKRFLNALLLRTKLAAVARLTIRDDVLVKLMLLEYTHSDLLPQLYTWQAAADGHPPQLVHLERAARGSVAVDMTAVEPAARLPEGEHEPWKDKNVQAWLRLDPELAGIDLRDYFWIARDRLRSTLSELTMVSPFVRQVFELVLGMNEGEKAQVLSDVVALDAEDRRDLLRLLGQRIRRQADDEAAVKGAIAVAETGVPGALDTLLAALGAVATDTLEPYIAYDLQELARRQPTTRGEISALLRTWSATQSGIGKAAEDALAGMTGTP